MPRKTRNSSRKKSTHRSPDGPARIAISQESDDRGSIMMLRTKTSLVLLAIVSTMAFSLSYSQDKFRLKPGAKGKVCLTCHEAFKEKLKLPFLHTPVKAGDCSDCHNPPTPSPGAPAAGGSSGGSRTSPLRTRCATSATWIPPLRTL